MNLEQDARKTLVLIGAVFSCGLMADLISAPDLGIGPPTWRTATSPRRRSTSPGLREDPA